MIHALINTAIKNKHTSGSALAFAVVKVGARIGRIWCPKYDHQIQSTADALESLAMLYLGVAAADVTKSLSKEQAGTEFLKKTEVKASAKK